MHLGCSHLWASWAWPRQCTILSAATLLWYSFNLFCNRILILFENGHEAWLFMALFKISLMETCARNIGGRNRGWSKGATSYFLSLLWSSIYNDAPDEVCSNAGRKDAKAWGYRVARQHRLVRRKVLKLFLNSIAYLMNFLEFEVI